MKWPSSLTLIRHDESAFNALKKLKEKDALYRKFRAAFESDPRSEFTKTLAFQVKEKFSLKFSDSKTPLARGAGHQAEIMAGKLKNVINLPDIIFVSPYERTLRTLENMAKGWPELNKIKTVEEGRIREQEHGLALIYNDWRVMQALHPEQLELYGAEGEYYYRYPQGESVEDVRERGRSWLNTLTREFAEKEVLGVTHHLTILATRANLERLGAEEFLDLDAHNKPINCGVTIYRGSPEQGKDGRLMLDRYNAKLY